MTYEFNTKTALTLKIVEQNCIQEVPPPTLLSQMPSLNYVTTVMVIFIYYIPCLLENMVHTVYANVKRLAEHLSVWL